MRDHTTQIAATIVRQALEQSDLALLLRTCTENVIFEFPFSPVDRPRRLTGKEAVRAYLEPIFRHTQLRELRDWTVHDMLDPAMAVLEFSAVYERVSGLLLEAPYMVFLEVHEGRIWRYRDYWSAAAVMPVAETRVK